MSANRVRVVVTGLGATTPARWRRRLDLVGAPRRSVGRQTLTEDWVDTSRCGSRGRPRSTRPRCCPGPSRAGSTAASSSPWSPPGRRGRTPGARPRSDAASGSASSCRQRHRRHHHHADRLRHLQGAGLEAAVALHRADADAQRPGRLDRPRAGRPGRRARHRVSACASGAEAIGYAMDMIRAGRADVVVAGGTEAAIHGAEHGRLRRRCAPCPPATTTRSARRGPGTATVTGSCSARARASWCWSPRSTPRPAAPDLRRTPPASATPPTPTTSPSPSPRAGASAWR